MFVTVIDHLLVVERHFGLASRRSGALVPLHCSRCARDALVVSAPPLGFPRAAVGYITGCHERHRRSGASGGNEGGGRFYEVVYLLRAAVADAGGGDCLDVDLEFGFGTAGAELDASAIVEDEPQEVGGGKTVVPMLVVDHLDHAVLAEMTRWRGAQCSHRRGHVGSSAGARESHRRGTATVATELLGQFVEALQR